MKKRTKNNIKKACGVWGRVVCSTVLCAFLYFSLLMVVNMLFLPEIGYQITETDESGRTTVVTEYEYKDGEDSTLEVKLEEGQRRVPIHGPLSTTVSTTFGVLCSALMLMMVGVFPYGKMWRLGNADENKVKFGRKKKDMLRGLKIGALATVPTAVLYVLLVMAKYGIIPSAYFSVYRIFNIPYLPYINWVAPTTAAQELSWLSLSAIAATLLFVPTVCAVGYVLGYRDFSVRERLIYQKRISGNPEEI